jgi:putative peptide-modifying radical SAM enzyme
MKEFNNNLDKKFKFDFSCPDTSNIPVSKLKDFLNKDKEAVLIFYGGEPLLEIEKIKDIMDKIHVPFRMQTNGKLLKKLPAEYLNRIGKILISIDGDEKRTDFNKGKGTYEQVIENLDYVRSKHYKGELIARMVISPEANAYDLYEQVKHLISIGFNSVHWQIDAGFYKFDYNKKRFSDFVEKYNRSTSQLMDYWINDMQRNKRVLKLYPFLAIVESLLKNKSTKLRCGAGHSGYAITTDRKVIACPIMNCIVDFQAGNLDTNPADLKKFDVSGRCPKCDYLNLCGGRCLYWNKAELWPKEGDDLICKTIKHLIDEVKLKMPKIKYLTEKGFLMEKDFDYEKYFGPEIIP